jgi:cystathionine beta-lyase/cystathionine gamma-synthase
MKQDTLVIHGGIPFDPATGAVNNPVYFTSTYKQNGNTNPNGFEYARCDMPTRSAVEKILADLEGGTYALAFASGLAAIETVLNTFLPGDEIVLSENLYGGTYRLLKDHFSRYGILYKMVDTSDMEILESAISPATKAIFIETPTNPTLQITDISAVANLAKRHGILSIVDNTFMTPYFQKPLSLGADIVVHSATKYLGGHSDLLAGAVVLNDKKLYDTFYLNQYSIGNPLNPMDCFLLSRGIKTLAVRMDKHNQNATYIASELSKKADEYGITRIYYPGLFDGKAAEVHNKQATGFGGIISFELAPEYDLKKFFESLELIFLAESLGGVETLVCHPASMTHATIEKAQREKVGISDNLVRLSVGIENADDILEDVLQALKRATK